MGENEEMLIETQIEAQIVNPSKTDPVPQSLQQDDVTSRVKGCTKYQT